MRKFDHTFVDFFLKKIRKGAARWLTRPHNDGGTATVFFFLSYHPKRILSREGGGFSPPMRGWWFHPPRLCGCGTQHPVATNTQLGRTFRPLRSFSGAPVMVGMFFSDGVLVAGVAVGRRGPLAFSVKCTVNSYIYMCFFLSYMLYTLIYYYCLFC